MLFVFTMSIKTVTVSKVSNSPPPPIDRGITRKTGFKKTKTYPASSLRKTRKIRAVANPTQPPPATPGTIRILTRQGQEADESTIKQKVDSMSEPEIRKTLARSGLTLRSKNKHLAKLILGSGMAAGMIPH
jgi:hypothetical protein